MHPPSISIRVDTPPLKTKSSGLMCLFTRILSCPDISQVLLYSKTILHSVLTIMSIQCFIQHRSHLPAQTVAICDLTCPSLCNSHFLSSFSGVRTLVPRLYSWCYLVSSDPRLDTTGRHSTAPFAYWYCCGARIIMFAFFYRNVCFSVRRAILQGNDLM